MIHEVSPVLRVAGKGISQAFIHLVSNGVDIRGMENLPPKPPYIVAFNHPGWLEGVVPYAILPDWPYTMTKIENMEGLLGKILAPLGFFGVRRGEMDREALRHARELLQTGHVLATSPEGTRGRGDARLSMKEGKKGVVYLATSMEPPVPVVPMAVFGENECLCPLIDEEGFRFSDLKQLRHAPLFVRIGEPLHPQLENIGENKSAELDRWTLKLMESIYGLIPEEYRQSPTEARRE